MRRVTAVVGVFALGSSLFAYSYIPERVDVVRHLPLPKSSEKAELLFVGDMMLDRTIRAVLDEKGADAVFDEVAPLLQSADFVAGNLEGPITTYPSESLGTLPGEEGNTRFTFDPRVAGILASYGFRLVSTGNNHINDFGAEGAMQTEGFLSRAHIKVVGSPRSTTEPVIEDVAGIRVAFTAYNEFIYPDMERTRGSIRQAAALGADFIVVLAHWGDEYDHLPPARVRAVAKSFADAGAHLIIGTHSHVIGEIEDISKTRVYYSLGNFVFDQYWSESVRCGLAVEVSLTKTFGKTTATYETTETHLERSGLTKLGCF